MRWPLACSIAALLASPLAAGDAIRRVSVRVLDAKDRPARGIDVLMCPLGASLCVEAATTNAKGVAQFQKAPREIVYLRIMPGLEVCGLTNERVDLRTDEPPSVVLRVPARGNLGLRLMEHQEGGPAKPLRTTEVRVNIRPSPALPNQVSQSSHWPKSKSPTDRFEVCVAPGSGYDVEVEIPGFYLGSARTPGPAPDGTVEVPITVRRKPTS